MKTCSTLAVMGLVLAGFLTGCATSDIGEVASRKSILPGAQRTPPQTGEKLTPTGILGQTEKALRDFMPEKGGVCEINDSTEPKAEPTEPKTNPFSEFTNLNGLGRQTPAESLSSRIKAKDMVSLRLRSVFLSDEGYTPESIFSDLGTSAQAMGETSAYLSKGFSGNGFQVNLEVLVAANAFDYGAKDVGFGFKPGDRRNAKVIFFSDDVDEGQFLNLENLPIIGPVEYSGIGFGLQLYVLEIDAEDEQQKALLKSLAGLGTAAAGATGPASSVLNTLTNALIETGNGDDRMFEYSIGFDSAFDGANIDYVSFEENIYAFVIDHERRQRVPWHLLALNSETAKLYQCNTKSRRGVGRFTRDRAT